jgi:hypothetical protein
MEEVSPPLAGQSDGHVTPFTSLFPPVRKYQGRSEHSKWERARTKRGACIKCNEPLDPRSKRYCRKHGLAANEASKVYRLKQKGIVHHRCKISSHRARVRVMEALGGLVCAHCGERDYRVLSIDHRNGHDAPIKQRRKHRSGLNRADIYKILRGEMDASDLRVLCANCQAKNEHRRGNRVVYPEVREAVIEAGGFIGDDVPA